MSSNKITELFSLEDKVAIVTDATHGLGQAIAIGLAEAGADVVAIGATLDALEATKHSIEEIGRKVLCLACDQCDAEQIDKTVFAAQEAFGEIDILINNPDTIAPTAAQAQNDVQWEDILCTHLTGVFRFCRAAGKVMLSQGYGKIINVASLLSYSGGSTDPGYAASKGGVDQLTKALANEWAASNIQVNAIAPGYFEIDDTARLRADPKRHAAITERIPSGAWGQPNDLQGAVIFLASEASRYVNGHTLTVDGGWLAR